MRNLKGVKNLPDIVSVSQAHPRWGHRMSINNVRMLYSSTSFDSSEARAGLGYTSETKMNKKIDELVLMMLGLGGERHSG